LGGGVDAAELLRELEGPFSLGPVGQEAAGLPAHPLLGIQGPLVGVGEGSISLRRWLTAYRVLRKAGALMRQSGSVRALP
jgi:hypothetical protein